MPPNDTSRSLDFQALFNASPNAYVLLDTDLKIVEANEAYLETVGREKKDVVGRHLFEAFPGDPGRSEDPNVGRLKTSFEKVLSTREPESLALIPYVIPRNTGEGIDYEKRYWSATHTPIFDEDGDIEYILQHTTDVTELFEKGYYEEDSQEASSEGEIEPGSDVKQSSSSRSNEEPESTPTPQQVEEGIMSRAEAIQQAYWGSEKEREQLQRLFDQAPGFMTFLSEPGHVFEMANEAYYQLVGHRDIIGKPVREALPEVVEQGFPELLDEVYETGEPFVGREMEVQLQKAPGEELETVYLDFIYQPVVDSDGEVTGIFVQGHDVTDKKLAMDRLRQQRAELKELNETLEDRVEERTREVRELTSQITRVEQEERRRIGQELHDGLASQLTGANIKLGLLARKVEGGLAEEIEEVQEIIEKGADNVRRLSRGLNPGGLTEGDLSSALEGLIQSIEGAHLEMGAELSTLDLGEEEATHLYRIAQEAVSNARRHGDASTIVISLEKEGDALFLEIEDDGRGFDPEEIGEGLGLRSMRRRAEFLGAELEIESSSTRGAVVRCRLPL